MLLGAVQCHSRVAQLPFERCARRRSLRHGLLERCPGVRCFQCSLFLRCLDRGRRGSQLLFQRVTLVGELGDAGSGRRVVSGETLRIGGALRDMTRLGLLDVSLKARELLCRRHRVCCAVLLGAVQCHSRVAQLPFEGCARRGSLRHGLLERCPGVRLFEFSLFLGCFERGGRGTQLPFQRVTLVGELGDACGGRRVVSGETLCIRGAL